LDAGGRNVAGARTCSIDGAINGTSVFPGGVPDMQFLKGLSPDQIQAISDSLNSNPATGQQRYITACAGCHGVEARGGRVGEGAKGANAGDILEAIREEGAMGFLGCLPASDVKDIGNYLKGSNSSRGGSEGRGGNRGRGGSKGRD
jgi:mono/diheme cytochrome c family protein